MNLNQETDQIYGVTSSQNVFGLWAAPLSLIKLSEDDIEKVFPLQLIPCNNSLKNNFVNQYLAKQVLTKKSQGDEEMAQQIKRASL